jgi:hypothetical protein
MSFSRLLARFSVDSLWPAFLASSLISAES